MKRILVAGFIAAFAALGLAAPASAAPSDAACFGQVHKSINVADGSVGDLVKVVGGQGKKAAARGMC